jgi:hypothetical protein
MSKHEQKIKDGAQPFLEEGEEILAALIARPRGWTQASAGSAGPGMLASELGLRKKKQQEDAGEQAGLQLASPMALAITPRRLLVFKTSSPIGMGVGGEIQELVSEAPLSDVDSIELKRLLVGKIVKLRVRGTEIKLEVNAAANAKGLVEAFEGAKAPA